MGSLEKSRFVGLSKSEEEDLSCSICLCLFHNPMVTPCCQQKYCSDCIKRWVREHNTCPNDRTVISVTQLRPAPRMVTNTLNGLKVWCKFRDNGCEQTVLLAELAQHVVVCQYNPDGICAKCGEKIGVKVANNCYYHVLISKTKTLEIERDEAIARNIAIQQERDEAIARNIVVQRERDEWIESYESMLVNFTALNEESYRLVVKNQRMTIEINTMRERNEMVVQHANNLEARLNKSAHHSSSDDEPQAISDEHNHECDQPLIALKREPTIKFAIEKFSTFLTQSSEQCVINGLPWKLVAQVVGDLLRIYLQCMSDRSSINTPETYRLKSELRVVAQKDNSASFCRFLERTYFLNSCDWGYEELLNLEYITDNNNGFIKNDTVLLEVYVSTFMLE